MHKLCHQDAAGQGYFNEAARSQLQQLVGTMRQYKRHNTVWNGSSIGGLTWNTRWSPTNLPGCCSRFCSLADQLLVGACGSRRAPWSITCATTWSASKPSTERLQQPRSTEKTKRRLHRQGRCQKRFVGCNSRGRPEALKNLCAPFHLVP